MRLMVSGNGTLAAATTLACSDHFEVSGVAPELLWVCRDTPLGEDDRPGVDELIAEVRKDIERVDPDVPILISSQIPVGTMALLEGVYPGRFFAYSPENIRVKTAFEDFCSQARVVVGRRDDKFDGLFLDLFDPFARRVIFTDPETAEMVKHALNAYLGMSIAFINEIARLSAVVGANADTISEALRSEPRVSPKAPLKPGPPFGEGHLARDLYVLEAVAKARGVYAPLVASIRASNRLHEEPLHSHLFAWAGW